VHENIEMTDYYLKKKNRIKDTKIRKRFFLRWNQLLEITLVNCEIKKVKYR
jgi:hypothetical protein